MENFLWNEIVHEIVVKYTSLYILSTIFQNTVFLTSLLNMFFVIAEYLISENGLELFFNSLKIFWQCFELISVTSFSIDKISLLYKLIKNNDAQVSNIDVDAEMLIKIQSTFLEFKKSKRRNIISGSNKGFINKIWCIMF